MPIRVQIERVGYYEQYPDAKIYDLLITREDEETGGFRKYTVADRVAGNALTVWHHPNTGVEALVQQALEVVNE